MRQTLHPRRVPCLGQKGQTSSTTGSTLFRKVVKARMEASSLVPPSFSESPTIVSEPSGWHRGVWTLGGAILQPNMCRTGLEGDT
jgi:hypothetical protein